ncbi:SseB family protein [Streptomyces sp. NPDC014733]|uniref:SseB family protein n=1 Tax=Streptomyces sp. NPDC014733 TaxID=3364885 RepID=UPI0036FD5FBD
MSLLSEISRIRDGQGNPAALVGEFRRTPVLIPLSGGDNLMSAESDGIRWIFAFSDEDALTRFLAHRGIAADDAPDHVTAVGARLLDVVIPALGSPAGVALNAGSELGMLFPPVTGIVPDAVAVDRAGTTGGAA